MPIQAPAPDQTASVHSQPHNETEVFAVHGADPEVLAYAMAKYSRSSLSMRQSLKEISSQRAEQFLNTFYFQYGHRSIADLAHVAFAIERLSLFAAIVLVDEQRWDGQERSTRYQNFHKSGWYLPNFDAETEARRMGEALHRDSRDAATLDQPPAGRSRDCLSREGHSIPQRDGRPRTLRRVVSAMR